MKYLTLKERLKGLTVFSLNDVRNLDDSFHRPQLNDWQARGYIRKVIKGFYVFSDLTLDDQALFEIANRIYAPSYVSFETALAYYGLIPENVYGLVSATSRRTYAFNTPIGRFTYRSLKPQLFFGYDLVSRNGHSFRLAGPEKTVMDYLYLNPSMKDRTDFSQWRLNRDVFLRLISRNRLFGYLEKYRQKSLARRVAGLWEYMSHA